MESQISKTVLLRDHKISLAGSTNYNNSHSSITTLTPDLGHAFYGKLMYNLELLRHYFFPADLEYFNMK